jgi:hypothetical protein
MQYTTPQLKRLGSLADLTLGSSGTRNDNRGRAGGRPANERGDD